MTLVLLTGSFSFWENKTAAIPLFGIHSDLDAINNHLHSVCYELPSYIYIIIKPTSACMGATPRSTTPRAADHKQCPQHPQRESRWSLGGSLFTGGVFAGVPTPRAHSHPVIVFPSTGTGLTFIYFWIQSDGGLFMMHIQYRTCYIQVPIGCFRISLQLYFTFNNLHLWEEAQAVMVTQVLEPKSTTHKQDCRRRIFT